MEKHAEHLKLERWVIQEVLVGHKTDELLLSPDGKSQQTLDYFERTCWFPSGETTWDSFRCSGTNNAAKALLELGRLENNDGVEKAIVLIQRFIVSLLIKPEIKLIQAIRLIPKTKSIAPNIWCYIACNNSRNAAPRS